MWWRETKVSMKVLEKGLWERLRENVSRVVTGAYTDYFELVEVD
jgi:hypothetical protein